MSSATRHVGPWLHFVFISGGQDSTVHGGAQPQILVPLALAARRLQNGLRRRSLELDQDILQRPPSSSHQPNNQAECDTRRLRRRLGIVCLRGIAAFSHFPTLMAVRDAEHYCRMVLPSDCTVVCSTCSTPQMQRTLVAHNGLRLSVGH